MKMHGSISRRARNGSRRPPHLGVKPRQSYRETDLTDRQRRDPGQCASPGFFATTGEVVGCHVLVDSCSITDSSTVSRLVLPLSEPGFPRSNSIQLSLKPSNIRMRGTGFFIACDLKSASHDSRGTTFMRTGLPKSFARAVATNGACTNDQNLHDVVLVLSAAVPRIDFTRSAEDDPSSDSP
jgi:hypothetical protein